MKKKWFAIPLALGVLGFALTGSSLFAHGGGHGGGPRSNDIAARVANILELEESQVQAAFDQVHRENQDQRLQSKLDRLVEAEKISPELSEETMSWYQDRPDAALHLGRAALHGEEVFQRRLDRLVEKEAITEAEAEDVAAWYDARPEGWDDVQIGHQRRSPEGRFQRGPNGESTRFHPGYRGHSQVRSLAPSF
ncbi:MAG: hypothetical protein ACE5Q6_03820 [Dehalococcoidia bacterium]